MGRIMPAELAVIDLPATCISALPRFSHKQLPSLRVCCFILEVSALHDCVCKYIVNTSTLST